MRFSKRAQEIIDRRKRDGQLEKKSALLPPKIQTRKFVDKQQRKIDKIINEHHCDVCRIGHSHWSLEVPFKTGRRLAHICDDCMTDCVKSDGYVTIPFHRIGLSTGADVDELRDHFLQDGEAEICMVCNKDVGDDLWTICRPDGEGMGETPACDECLALSGDELKAKGFIFVSEYLDLEDSNNNEN